MKHKRAEPARVLLTNNRTLHIHLDEQGKAWVPFTDVGVFSLGWRAQVCKALCKHNLSKNYINGRAHLGREELTAVRPALRFITDADLAEIIGHMAAAEAAHRSRPGAGTGSAVGQRDP